MNALTLTSVWPWVDFVVTGIWDKIETRALSEAYCFVNNQILFQYEKYC